MSIPNLIDKNLPLIFESIRLLSPKNNKLFNPNLSNIMEILNILIKDILTVEKLLLW